MNQEQPLAERMRPKNLSDFIGQRHLVSNDGVLFKAIEKGYLPSLIFWGPPGVGKTTLANIIAQSLKRPFYTLSAINSGVKEIREVLDKAAQQTLFSGKPPVLFIDEIHRFSKSQQDSLLAAVEKGQITLIGATTENPSFEVISALLSRCQVYTLNPLTKSELMELLNKAIEKDEKVNKKNILIKEYDALLQLSGGDARKLLNTFELLINSANSNQIIITNDFVLKQVQQKPLLYDKSGEQHYDIVSAFIKSIRGSDPNAAVYWLARMIAGGEDPLFICRRMIILASEDIGLANPNALLLANTCFQTIEKIGMPEGRIIMSQTAIYLASSPKSNSAYMAINKALELVNKTGDLSVPLALRNAPTALMKELNYGKEYKYAHNYENNFVWMEFLPEEIKNTCLYTPGNNLREKEISNYLNKLWKDKYSF
jgi:putative ATPase